MVDIGDKCSGIAGVLKDFGYGYVFFPKRRPAGGNHVVAQVGFPVPERKEPIARQHPPSGLNGRQAFRGGSFK